MGRGNPAWQKGVSGNPKGKKPGTVSKSTIAAREAFQLAFDKLGGADALVKWANESKANRTEFYKLYARLIPVEVSAGSKAFELIVSFKDDKAVEGQV